MSGKKQCKKKENRNELKQNQDELHLHKNVQKDSTKISFYYLFIILKKSKFSFNLPIVVYIN